MSVAGYHLSGAVKSGAEILGLMIENYEMQICVINLPWPILRYYTRGLSGDNP